MPKHNWMDLLRLDRRFERFFSKKKVLSWHPVQIVDTLCVEDVILLTWQLFRC